MGWDALHKENYDYRKHEAEIHEYQMSLHPHDKFKNTENKKLKNAFFMTVTFDINKIFPLYLDIL